MINLLRLIGSYVGASERSIILFIEEPDCPSSLL